MSDWITHDGGPCPCKGKVVEIQYNDGDTDIGLATEGLYWRYVARYRHHNPISALIGKMFRASNAGGYVYA